MTTTSASPPTAIAAPSSSTLTLGATTAAPGTAPAVVAVPSLTVGTVPVVLPSRSVGAMPVAVPVAAPSPSVNRVAVSVPPLTASPASAGTLAVVVSSPSADAMAVAVPPVTASPASTGNVAVAVSSPSFEAMAVAVPPLTATPAGAGTVAVAVPSCSADAMAVVVPSPSVDAVPVSVPSPCVGAASLAVPSPSVNGVAVALPSASVGAVAVVVPPLTASSASAATAAVAVPSPSVDAVAAVGQPLTCTPTGAATAAVAARSPSVAANAAGANMAAVPAAGVVSAVPAAGVVSADAAAIPDVSDASERTSTSDPAVEDEPREKADELISVIMRCIFKLGPAVVQKGNRTHAMPLLAIMYFTSKMAFLSGCPVEPVEQSDRQSVNDSLSSMFDVPLLGWRKMCATMGVSDYSLLLSGRLVESKQFMGLPASVPRSLQRNINPTGKAQWVSLRMILREHLSLYPAANGGPGGPTADELQKVRAMLGTAAGDAAAKAAGCIVQGGTVPGGSWSPIASIKYNWNFPWRAACPAVKLVQTFSKRLLKAPNNSLSMVRNHPGHAVAASAAAVVPNGAPKSLPPLAEGGSKRTGGKAAEQGRGMKRSKGDEADVQGVHPGAVPDDASYWSTRTTVADIQQSQSWPAGAWILQICLPEDLDESALGKVPLDINVAVDESHPFIEAGPYKYIAYVTPGEVEQTSKTTKLSRSISAMPEIDDVRRSFAFLEAAKRIDRTRARRLGLCRSSLATPDASQVSGSPSGCSAGIASGPRHKQGDDDEVDTDTTDAPTDAPLVPSEDLRMAITHASPLPRQISFDYPFTTTKRLDTQEVDVLRDAGRLWVAVGVSTSVKKTRKFRA